MTQFLHDLGLTRAAVRSDLCSESRFHRLLAEQFIRLSCWLHQHHAQEHRHCQHPDQHHYCAELCSQVGIRPITNITPDLLHRLASLIGCKGLPCQPVCIGQRNKSSRQHNINHHLLKGFNSMHSIHSIIILLKDFISIIGYFQIRYALNYDPKVIDFLNL